MKNKQERKGFRQNELQIRLQDAARKASTEELYKWVELYYKENDFINEFEEDKIYKMDKISEFNDDYEKDFNFSEEDPYFITDNDREYGQYTELTEDDDYRFGLISLSEKGARAEINSIVHCKIIPIYAHEAKTNENTGIEFVDKVKNEYYEYIKNMLISAREEILIKKMIRLSELPFVYNEELTFLDNLLANNIIHLSYNNTYYFTNAWKIEEIIIEKIKEKRRNSWRYPFSACNMNEYLVSDSWHQFIENNREYTAMLLVLHNGFTASSV